MATAHLVIDVADDEPLDRIMASVERLIVRRVSADGTIARHRVPLMVEPVYAHPHHTGTAPTIRVFSRPRED